MPTHEQLIDAEETTIAQRVTAKALVAAYPGNLWFQDYLNATEELLRWLRDQLKADDAPVDQPLTNGEIDFME